MVYRYSCLAVLIALCATQLQAYSANSTTENTTTPEYTITSPSTKLPTQKTATKMSSQTTPITSTSPDRENQCLIHNMWVLLALGAGAFAVTFLLVCCLGLLCMVYHLKRGGGRNAGFHVDAVSVEPAVRQPEAGITMEELRRENGSAEAEKADKTAGEKDELVEKAADTPEEETQPLVPTSEMEETEQAPVEAVNAAFAV